MEALNYWRRMDQTLLITVLVLAAIGITVIASATHANMTDLQNRFDFVVRQSVFFFVGLTAAGFGLRFDYRSCTAGFRCFTV